MSKSILVIDTPPCCLMCECSSVVFGDQKCQVVGENITHEDIYDRKPEWCPLKPIPEKMQVRGRYQQSDGITPSYKIGFNACIDEILKE